MPILRPCLGCGELTENERPARCRTCRRERSTTGRGLGHEHRKVAARVLSEEQLCHLCGLPARPGDPLTADHVIPRAHGGTSTRENLRAAHRSCNSSRGARPLSS